MRSFPVLRVFLLLLASARPQVSQRWGRHVHVRAAPRAQEAAPSRTTGAIEPLLALRGGSPGAQHAAAATLGNLPANNHNNTVATARATREQKQAGAWLLTTIAGVLLAIVAVIVAALLELVWPSKAVKKWCYSRWTNPSQLRAKATAKKAATRQRRRQVSAEAEAERAAAQAEAHQARADAKAAAVAATAAATAQVEAARAEVEAARAEIEERVAAATARATAAALADAIRRSATLLAERNAERGAAGEQASAPAETAGDSPCVVCCDAEATHILAPCGHRAVCAGCARLIEECPLCRARVLCVVGKVYTVN